jgi:hypothetical protein
LKPFTPLAHYAVKYVYVVSKHHQRRRPKTLLLRLLCIHYDTRNNTLQYTFSSLITYNLITMKFSLALLSVMAATSSAFMVQQPVAFRSVSQLQGKAAASKEEDIEMTRKLILQSLDGEETADAPAVVEAEAKEEAKEE